MKPDHPMDPELALLSHLAMESKGLPPNTRHSITALQGDGSDRKFFRIRMGTSRIIALISPRVKDHGVDENDSYYLFGRHLSCHGIPVPQILWADRRRGLFLLQDLGDYHLQRHVNRRRTNVATLYGQVLKLLVKLHRLGPLGFEPHSCFDTALYSPAFVYERELEYFRKSFLIGCLGLEISEEDLRTEFQGLADAAGVQKSSLIMHRDFQSRNIMIHGGTLWLLDFQGMRHGPPTYDLASLLVDPYVVLPYRLQKSLVELYWTSAREFLGCSFRQFMDSYKAVRLTRNLQALAAYSHLGLVKGKSAFLSYIPRAWRRLLQWVNGPCRGWYPRMESLVNCVERSGKVDRCLRRHEKTFW